MKRHLVLGIDPGATGAIAYRVLNEDDDGIACDAVIAGFGGSVPADGKIRIKDLGSNRMEVVENMRDVLDACLPYSAVHVFIEKSFVMPGTAVDAAETYMRHYGNIEAALLCFGVPEDALHEIDPHDWQKHYPELVPPRSKKGHAMDRAERRRRIKENSRKTAIGLFPYLSSLFSRVRDDGRADAALILAYGTARVQGCIKVSPSKAEAERRENHGRKKKSRRSGSTSRRNAAPAAVSAVIDDIYPPY